MDDTLYKILPLEWKAYNPLTWVCETNIGTLCVYRLAPGKWVWKTGEMSCGNPCKNSAHGKELCEAEYRRRLLACLIPAGKDETP